MSNTADIGDFESSRGYPLTIAAAATEIPGYEGCSTADRTRFNNLPFGSTFIVRSSAIPTTIPVGATFRKLTQTAYASGGRITRVINPLVDVILAGSAVDSFITSLAASVAVDNVVTVYGTMLRGNGAAYASAPVEIALSGLAGQTIAWTGNAGTTLIYQVPAAAAGGAIAQFTAAAVTGAFSATATYSGAVAGAANVVVNYLGLSITVPVTVT